jgi:hypothetical protein
MEVDEEFYPYFIILIEKIETQNNGSEIILRNRKKNIKKYEAFAKEG